MVLPLKDLSSVQVSRSDSPECKLVLKDFNLLNDRFSAPTSRLLDLHHRHRKGTTMHKILVLWDHAIVVGRLGTMLTCVQESKQIRLQPQTQIRMSTAMATIVHLLQQGRTNLMLTWILKYHLQRLYLNMNLH
jgi:hypothetical protein